MYKYDKYTHSAGEIFSLPCVVNTSQCGEYHSLKWYKVNFELFLTRS